jgi:hypothetical protein
MASTSCASSNRIHLNIIPKDAYMASWRSTTVCYDQEMLEQLLDDTYDTGMSVVASGEAVVNLPDTDFLITVKALSDTLAGGGYADVSMSAHMVEVYTHRTKVQTRNVIDHVLDIKNTRTFDTNSTKSRKSREMRGKHSRKRRIEIEQDKLLHSNKMVADRREKQRYAQQLRDRQAEKHARGFTGFTQ